MDSIEALSLRDAVRKRPGMYIGDVHDGSGLLHMVWEAVANSLDQFLSGKATRVDVTLEANGAVVVEDDGAGIPVTPLGSRTFLEVAFTEYHATPTLDGHAPHEHVGLRGVGMMPVNFLSERLAVRHTGTAGDTKSSTYAVCPRPRFATAARRPSAARRSPSCGSRDFHRYVD